MERPKVLVTGATGLVGSRVVRALVEAGERVKALARPGASLRALADLPPGSVEVAEGDILVGHTVFRALAGCDRLFHVAAVFKLWDRDPRAILDGAIRGTSETLDAARRRGIDKIVVTSSTVAVGVSNAPVEMDETFEWNGERSDKYVVAKRRAEEVALGAAREGLPVVIVNPCTVLGPGDWKPTPSGDLVRRYLVHRLPGGFPYADGGLSVVDSDDVARGHLLAMQKGRVGERYVLGGENVTYEQLIQLLSEITGLSEPGPKVSRGVAAAFGRMAELWARATGREPPLTHKMARDFVGHWVWVSSAKAERDLGYAHRPARETLRRSVRFLIESGLVPDALARRVRLDVRAAA